MPGGTVPGFRMTPTSWSYTLFEWRIQAHNRDMEHRGIQMSIRAMLALVACVAVNIWCFKVSALLGFVGLNITKHVIIAQLCLVLGVNRQPDAGDEMPSRDGNGISSPLGRPSQVRANMSLTLSFPAGRPDFDNLPGKPPLVHELADWIR